MKLSTDESEIALSYSYTILDYNNLLCKMIKNSIDMGGGNFQAYTFRGSLNQPIKDFSSGNSSNPAPLNEEKISSKISILAADFESCFCIVDDVMADMQDISKNEDAIMINDEVYHFLSKDKISDYKIDEIMSVTSVAWHSIAVLIEAKSITQVLSYMKIGKAPAGSVVSVALGAFDGEGYLYWTLD